MEEIEMDLMAILSAGQFLGGLILTFGYIPQIIKSIKTKSVDDFDTSYYPLLFTGIMLMEIYALGLVFIQHAGHMFLVTNSASVILTGTMMLLGIIYRTKK